MTALQVLHLTDVAPTPWKNGGGLTRDLLHWPPGPREAWQLRVSVAEVAQSGPFSAYPGVQRWFCVLQGAGVVLRWGDDEQRLTPDSPPLQFDGAQAPACSLLAGATLDLNLMAQQAAGHAEMRRVIAGVPWVSSAPLRAVFTLQGGTLRVAGARPVDLPAGSLAFTDQADREAWTLDASGHGHWWLAYQAHTR